MGTIFTHLQEAIHWIAHHAFRRSPPSSEVPLLEDWSPTVPMEASEVRVDIEFERSRSPSTDDILGFFVERVS